MTAGPYKLSRRLFLQAGATVLLAACSRPSPQSDPQAGEQMLRPTPACDDQPTPRQAEGPFYTARTPERTSLLEPGQTGIRLVLTGQVLSQNCQPVAGALLDFWQADANGAYDNTGFRLRGHQFADAEGRYQLETVMPGRYPGRTPHIHVKVQAPNRPLLTTQLYFPGEPQNRTDGLYRKELLMELKESPDGMAGRFTFVV